MSRNNVDRRKTELGPSSGTVGGPLNAGSQSSEKEASSSRSIGSSGLGSIELVLRAREAVMGKQQKGFVDLKRMSHAIRPGPAKVWWEVTDPPNLDPMNGRWESKGDWLAFRPKNKLTDRRDTWLEHPNWENPGWYAGRGGGTGDDDAGTPIHPGAGGVSAPPKLVLDFGLGLPHDRPQATRPLIVGHLTHGCGPRIERPQEVDADFVLRPRSCLGNVSFEGRMGREELSRPPTQLGHVPENFYGEALPSGEGKWEWELNKRDDTNDDPSLRVGQNLHEPVLEQVGGVEPHACQGRVFASEREAFKVHLAMKSTARLREGKYFAEYSGAGGGGAGGGAWQVEENTRQLRAHLRAAYTARQSAASVVRNPSTTATKTPWTTPRKPVPTDFPTKSKFRPLRKCVAPA